MKASISSIPKGIAVLSECYFNNILIFTIACNNYNAYLNLPLTLFHKGVECSRLDWANGSKRCVYKQAYPLKSF